MRVLYVGHEASYLNRTLDDLVLSIDRCYMLETPVMIAYEEKPAFPFPSAIESVGTTSAECSNVRLSMIFHSLLKCNNLYSTSRKAYVLGNWDV